MPKFIKLKSNPSTWQNFLNHTVLPNTFSLNEPTALHQTVDNNMIPLNLFNFCCLQGKLEHLKWLIEKFELTNDQVRQACNVEYQGTRHAYWAILYAAQNGHIAVVGYLFTFFSLAEQKEAAAASRSMVEANEQTKMAKQLKNILDKEDDVRKDVGNIVGGILEVNDLKIRDYLNADDSLTDLLPSAELAKKVELHTVKENNNNVQYPLDLFHMCCLLGKLEHLKHLIEVHYRQPNEVLAACSISFQDSQFPYSAFERAAQNNHSPIIIHLLAYFPKEQKNELMQKFDPGLYEKLIEEEKIKNSPAFIQLAEELHKMKETLQAKNTELQAMDKTIQTKDIELQSMTKTIQTKNMELQSLTKKLQQLESLKSTPTFSQEGKTVAPTTGAFFTTPQDSLDANDDLLPNKPKF